MSETRREPLAARSDAVVIRDAIRHDVDEIVEIERLSFTDPWSLTSFRSLVDDDRVFFRVAVGANAAIVGYLVAWFVHDEAEIANLAVDPTVRGRGIGAALLEVALREGTRRGTAAVYLEVRDSNAAARALYRSRGFAEIARRARYYRRPVEDAVVMRRLLASDTTGPAQRK
jgi:[ribosomal protein S18]-alanine N-acetyltransferase